jgi:inositol transport system substrate-binding protein
MDFMKRIAFALVAATMLASPAFAATKIGVSMAKFDDNFLTVLRNGIIAQGKELGVEIQVLDAENDVAKQLDQIKNFAANKVDAIIVNPVDTSATQAVTDAASAAKVPLVYVNRQPVNVDTLPANQAFVASNEADSGTLETKQICKLLAAKGLKSADIYVIEGELSNQAAVQRTKDIHEVIGGPDCGVKINILAEQTANWSRDEAQSLVTNWLSTGKKFDAIVSNNDEMAIGAIQALKAAGKDPKATPIGGVDATQDALAALQAGDLAATVFQDAAGQGKGSLDAAIKLAKGEKVDRKVYIPFQLVTLENIGKFIKKN